jgi:STE24 endopeptidase
MSRTLGFFFLRLGLLIACIGIPLTLLPGQATSAGSSQASSSTPPAAPRVTQYTLSSDKLQKAHGLYITENVMFFFGSFYGLALMLLFLRCRWMVKFRDFADRHSAHRFLQSTIVIPLFIATTGILTLPLMLYAQHIDREYGLSVQGWGSWLRDWSLQVLLGMALFTLLAWLLYFAIRRSPRRWWLYFWLAFVPISAFITFISPVAIEPLFNQYEPLQATNPALVARLEMVAARGGLEISPNRMFEMKASEKLTGSNAYVTGFGATKRVVVWDTAIRKLTGEQIMFVFGHEMGHYVLGHIVRGFIFAASVFLAGFYFTHKFAAWMQRRWGAIWGIRGLDDWASLPALWLAFSLFLSCSGPLLNAYSRHLEHQADQYGLEIVHELFPDSSQVAAQSFQILGEEWLEYPYLNPVAVFFSWDHPPIAERIQYALAYDPWDANPSPEFVKPTAPNR